MFSKTHLLALVTGATFVAAQTPAFTGSLLLQPGNSAAKCLQADDVNGNGVQLQSCVGAPNQQWRFENGQVKIHGNKCLDVVDGANVNGVKLQVWDCDANNPNQKFWYTAWGDNHLAWTDHGKCLDLSDGSLNNGNRVQLWECSGTNANQVWNVGYMASALPYQSANGQSGINDCGRDQNQLCQTSWINDAHDFCLWGPQNPDSAVGENEATVVVWCTKSRPGARVIPNGALTGVHFVKAKDYVQVTGRGDLTKLNIRRGDAGGELDPHGPDSRGNPVGGLVYGNTFGDRQQYHEWTSFIGDSEFCFRACTGPNARQNCQHIYDVMGCYWNMPANYDTGFDDCQSDNAQPMGVYGTSTWYQGVNPTPAAHPPPASSNCVTYPTIAVTPLKRRDGTEKKRMAAPGPMITAPPRARDL